MFYIACVDYVDCCKLTHSCITIHDIFFRMHSYERTRIIHFFSNNVWVLYPPPQLPIPFLRNGCSCWIFGIYDWNCFKQLFHFLRINISFYLRSYILCLTHTYICHYCVDCCPSQICSYF